jgi:Tfp pilus assembly PilM family ATPase
MVSLSRAFRKRTPIGVDIARTGVRAAQLSRCAEGYEVSNAAQVDLTDAVVDGGGQSSASAAALHRCIRGGRFHGRTVVLGLHPPDVEFHPMQLPSTVCKGDQADLARVVRVELHRLLDAEADNWEDRYWTVPDPTGHAPNVVGVTARREAVLARLARCDEAGLECRRVDAVAAALGRMAGLLCRWNPESIWGVLDLGFESAHLTLFVDRSPVLIRRAGPGGQLWTQRIAEALQVSRKAAEVQKCDHGIDFARTTDRTRTDKSTEAEIGTILHNALRSELRGLAAEIKRCYEYVLSCYPKRRAGDLVLVGGGATARNLPDFFSDALAIPVRRASSYLGEEGCRLRTDSDSAAPLEVYATAVGLALGE